MALFARRIVQRCLDEAAKFTAQDNLHDWVQRLNKFSDDYVATEWEIVLLWAISKFGAILHEPSIGGRPIDIVFDGRNGTLRFAADIVAISDQSLHKQNPIWPLREELTRRVTRAGIVSGGFSLQVKEANPIPSKGSGKRRRLLLPPVRQFSSLVFNEKFETFICAIRSNPSVRTSCRVLNSSPLVDLTVFYEPGRKGVGISSHGSYTCTTVIDDNPLYNALKLKAGQLRGSGYDGIRGVFVCDRSSRIFSEKSSWYAYSPGDVIREFFRQNSSISFVVTIALNSSTSVFGRGPYHDFQAQLFVRDLNERWVQELESLIVQAISTLPPIQQTPENAINSMKWNQSTLRTKPYLGGSELSIGRNRMTIKISSREVLDLLAGKLDHKRFAENHVNQQGGTNIFNLLRNRGAMIEGAGFESRPEEDDDWIVLRFREGDPAVSPFKEPKSGHQ